MSQIRFIFLSGTWFLGLSLVIVGILNAQETGSISGTVLAEDGTPVDDALVTLVDLRRQSSVDTKGAFRFEGLPPGAYLIQVESDRYGSLVERYEVNAGQTTQIEIDIGRHHHSDAIVVTGSADPRNQLELANPVTILSGESLALRIQPTLGDTLSQEAGVNQTWFAPGASRPIIRGLGSDRVRMLQGGLSTGDVSSTSPDHAVGVEPGAAQRIEVLRGPSTLLYGSTAIGGVVNVIDNTIPNLQPTEKITGQFDFAAGTVADELSGRADLNGGVGKWAWHFDGGLRQTDDYSIPDEYDPGNFEDQAEGEHQGEFIPGTLPNSDLETQNLAGGLAYFANKGFLGFSVSGFDTNYGVPGHEHAGEHQEEGEEHDDGNVRIDLERRRLDFSGEITQPFSIFRGFKARLGLVDYKHVELEGSEIGTEFLKDTLEGRFELVQKPKGRWSGALGLQILSDDLEAIGEEAFLPPSETTTWGLFAFEELSTGALGWQFGARIESVDHTVNQSDLADRSFTPVSLSVGLVWELPKKWSLGTSLARSQKAPNVSELYSDGPHAATRTVEIGDPTLNMETSLGFDLSLRRSEGPLHGDLTLFLNRFDDFIFQMFTGEEIDGLTVLRYVQSNAEFLGGELDIEYDLWHNANRHLDLKVMADYVRAELRDSGAPLPLIPPFRIGGGLHFGSLNWHAEGEVRWIGTQDRVSENELPTPSYTMVNASAGYRFFLGNQVFDLLIRGRNLTDELAFNASSVSKFERPMPGRDISLSLHLLF